MVNYLPKNPKIYHIVHVDRLNSIIQDGFLFSDAIIENNYRLGTKIGMNKIKECRLRLELNSYPDLKVGECVPFYFCPRSVMLFIMHQGNHPEVNYCGGQDSIIHLESSLLESVNWAEKNKKRCVFTD